VLLVENLPPRTSGGRQITGLGSYSSSEDRDMTEGTQSIASIVCGEHRLDFARRTVVMGIINTTTDSFSGDGIGTDLSAVMQQARSFTEAGADILDVGGQSTRPGSDEVPVEEELRRTIVPIKAMVSELGVPVSIDTSRPQVALAAVEAGACFINDVYALRRDGMIQAAADTGAGVCLMHMQGEPRTMQQQPCYRDVVCDVRDFLQQRIAKVVDGGVAEAQIMVDPGLGFGKTANHNLELVRRLRELTELGRPTLVGPSRKSTIGTVFNQPDPQQRLWGTAAMCAIAIANGAAMIRVHDVQQMVQVARMADAVMYGWQEQPQ
jgi:dihydropteroate synthase